MQKSKEIFAFFLIFFIKVYSYKYLAQICNKFVDTYTSTKADTSSINNISAQKIVCLVISIFMFSFLLSLTIDLYNFIPLTAKDNIHGINNIF